MPGRDGTGPRWERAGRRFCKRQNIQTPKDTLTYLENIKKEIDSQIEFIKLNRGEKQ